MSLAKKKGPTTTATGRLNGDSSTGGLPPAAHQRRKTWTWFEDPSTKARRKRYEVAKLSDEIGIAALNKNKTNFFTSTTSPSPQREPTMNNVSSQVITPINTSTTTTTTSGTINHAESLSSKEQREHITTRTGNNEKSDKFMTDYSMETSDNNNKLITSSLNTNKKLISTTATDKHNNGIVVHDSLPIPKELSKVNGTPNTDKSGMDNLGYNME